MNKVTRALLITATVTAASASQAEPRSFEDLSIHSNNRAGEVATQSQEAGPNISQYRPYHLRSAAVKADTEIAAFEEASGAAGYDRAKRSDRIPQ